ncbi:type VII secretion target [Nocardia abscessus]|uniref:type VII secretion target n=1 Tax=Nocardia abscessus TaxID=120957 RepID=UPI002456242A|nr:type VII secretion target [Nocardia abscessus]
MPDYLDVEPDQLRRVAEQHDLIAANIRKWGEIPRDWLADFPSKYGTIADPVRGALEDYYQRRHDNAERLAEKHERTRDEMLAAAAALEDGDQDNGRQVTQVGDFVPRAPAGGPPPGTPTFPAAPTDTGPDTPMMDGAQPGRPSALPDAAGTPDETGRSVQVPLSPSTSTPQAYDAGQPGAAAPTWAAPFSVGAAEPGATVAPAFEANTTVGANPDPNSAAGANLDVNGAAGAGPHVDSTGGMAMPPTPGPFQPPVVTGAVALAPRTPEPLAPGPFAAAAHVAKDKQAPLSFVVGERVDDDWVLAHTLLAATLAAVADSAPGVEWAVVVGRTPLGPIVMLTSTEGRGWLPPGLFLPSEVAVPWTWDSVLGNAARKAIAALEGTTDPARILAEFGLMVRRSNVRLSALVSSAAIPDDLRAALGDDVAIEGLVSAAESTVDFTSPGVGLVDRLALGGSSELLRQAVMMPETEIRAKCLELARNADARVRAAVSGVDAEIATQRARRQRILDALHADLPIPASWWDQLRAADGMMAAALRSRRVDVSHVPVGIRTDVPGTEAVRGMVFERRADELLLLLAAGEPDRQTLRDALYSYGQITEHPLFRAAARVVATETTRPGVAVPNGEVVPSVGPGPRVAGSVGLGGAPPSIAELPTSLARPEGAGEQRSA